MILASNQPDLIFLSLEKNSPAFGASRMKSIFVAPWAGASGTSVPARGPHADRANSDASRLTKNHSSNHEARYNDFAG
jgi:hypothetical protein